MKIVIFGASGATGKELVKQALAQGHRVTAFVRNASKLQIQHEQLQIQQGNVTDYTAVERSIKDQDAVLCALGASTPLRRDPALAEGVRNLVKAMDKENVNRLIYLSFLGVKESRKDLGLFVNFVVAPILRNVVADHEVKEEIIKQSGLEWTLVRPPRLTDGPKSGIYRSGIDIKPQSLILTISRLDLADFMLRQLTDKAYIRMGPRVMY